MLSGVLRLIANRLLLPRLLPKRARSQAPFLHRSYPASSVVRACPTPDLAATQVVAFGVATPARSGLPRCVVLPYQRAVPTTPADPNGCTYPVSFPVRCSLPRYTGGSASASLLSRPAQASLTLRPVNSLSRPRRPLSQGFSPPITRISCLSATRPNRLLSRWSLPPPATRPYGAHCAKSRWQSRAADDGARRDFAHAGLCSGGHRVRKACPREGGDRR